MPFPPTNVDKSGNGKLFFNPNTDVSTQIFPLAGLTQSGLWIPFRADDNGALIVTQENASVMTTSFDSFVGQLVPNEDNTLIDKTVPVGVSRTAVKVQVICRMEGSFFFTRDSIVVGSGRTGTGQSGVMEYSVPMVLVAGARYKVVFTPRDNCPAADLECYLQATDAVAS